MQCLQFQIGLGCAGAGNIFTAYQKSCFVVFLNPGNPEKLCHTGEKGFSASAFVFVSSRFDQVA